jgi:hypothetical protein
MTPPGWGRTMSEDKPIAGPVGEEDLPKEPEHIDSETCWCEPELNYTDPETGVSVYVHRRAQ